MVDLGSYLKYRQHFRGDIPKKHLAKKSNFAKKATIPRPFLTNKKSASDDQGADALLRTGFSPKI